MFGVPASVAQFAKIDLEAHERDGRIARVSLEPANLATTIASQPRWTTVKPPASRSQLREGYSSSRMTAQSRVITAEGAGSSDHHDSQHAS